jgi:hypothetical protein
MGWMPPETVESLVEDLRAEGLDARIAYDEVPGGGPIELATVMIWVADHVGGEIISILVGYALKWMRDEFRQGDPRPKAAEIIRYDGDEGTLVEIVVLRSPDDQPDRRSPEAFERYTQKKPDEGIRRYRG